MEKHLFKFVYVVSFCVHLVCNSNQLYREEGESCKTNGSQVCTLLRNCPSAIQLVKDRKNPEICKFLDKEPIVCCNVNDISIPKPKHKIFCEKYTSDRNRLLPPGFIDSKFINNYERPQNRTRRQIYNGEEATIGEFPYMAHIGFLHNFTVVYLCGGLLISENFVLTAGHCLYHQEAGDARYVRLGVLKVVGYDKDTIPQYFNVIETFLHPDYVPSLYNDIGLLQLDRNAVITKHVIPACLYSDFEINTQKVISAGWGDVGHQENSSNHLLKVELDWYSAEKCNDSYKDTFLINKRFRGILPETQLCAGGMGEIKDTCQGDSGGPLQIFDESKMFTVVGITSVGKLCGTTNTPGIYTRVSAYIQWIESIVWKN